MTGTCESVSTVIKKRVVGREFFKRLIVLSPIEEIPNLRCGAGETNAGRSGIGNPNKAREMGEGRGGREKCSHKAEDEGVRADAEADDENCGQKKSRVREEAGE